MKNRTKLVSLLLALALLLAMLPATVLAESPQENPPPVTGEYEVVITDCALPDYDDYTEAELLEGYLYSISGLYDGATAFRVPSKPLTEETQTIYDALKTLVKEVAAGSRSSTEFSLSGLSWTKTTADWGIAGNVIVDGSLTNQAKDAIGKFINSNLLLQRMLSEMPFEMYWFDKTKGIQMGYSVSTLGNNVTVSNLTIFMHVSQAYAKINESEGTYNPLLADTKKTSAAKTTAESARTIVTDNSSLTDYNKLVAYRNTICELVSYNNEATAPGYPYGDPWQLIYVFDGDESTNVVCEGYSKAFKYLCDLTWQGEDPAVECSLVTGTMTGGTGPGPHMWNVVAIGGSNYLADITNCDADTVGAPNKLFLCGVSGSANGSYTATVGSSSITYTYDESTKNNYTENELTLSPTAYTPSGADIPKIRGKVISYNGNNAFTVTLYQAGTENQVQSITVSGNKQSGQVTQDFTFKEVDTGTYDLVVTKDGHLTYTIKNVVVGDTPLDLTKHTNAAIRTITLLAGDVNGDGSINATDLNIVWNAANFNKAVADVSNKLTDVNGDRAVNATDLNNVWNAANFNKGTGDCTFNFK